MTDRTLTFIITAIVILVIGALLLRQLLGSDEQAQSTPEPEALEQESPRRTSVYAWLTDCSRNGEQTVATGTIRNTGNTELNYVSVNVLWMNKSGRVIEENTMFALSNSTLPPGETKTFTDVTERSTATKCNVEAVDWW